MFVKIWIKLRRRCFVYFKRRRRGWGLGMRVFVGLVEVFIGVVKRLRFLRDWGFVLVSVFVEFGLRFKG